MSNLIPRPMRATSCVDQLHRLSYPLWSSGKIDGIRALSVQIDGKVVATSRSGKPLPNKFIQEKFRKLPPGLDGELVVCKDIINKPFSPLPSDWRPFYGQDGIESVVMSQEHTLGQLINYQVFDYWETNRPFEERTNMVIGACGFGGIKGVYPVEHILVTNQAQAEEVISSDVHLGYEGTCFRDPRAKYKLGKSTLSEQALLKYKAFEDDEAEAVAFVELQHNTNEATTDSLGYTQRSHASAGQVPGGVLGVLIGHSKRYGRIEVGTGFSAADRLEIMKNWHNYVRRLFTYKFQRHGTMDKPRSPVFKWWRNPIDMI